MKRAGATDDATGGKPSICKRLVDGIWQRVRDLRSLCLRSDVGHVISHSSIQTVGRVVLSRLNTADAYIIGLFIWIILNIAKILEFVV